MARYPLATAARTAPGAAVMTTFLLEAVRLVIIAFGFILVMAFIAWLASHIDESRHV